MSTYSTQSETFTERYIVIFIRKIVSLVCFGVDLVFHTHKRTHAHAHAASLVAAHRHRGAHWVRSNGHRVVLRQEMSRE